MRLTIARKLYLGFGLMIALIISMGVLSIRGGSQGSAVADSYGSMLKYSLLGGSMQSNLLMARLKLEHYIRRMSEDDAKEFREWSEGLAKDIQTAKSSFTHPERLSLLAELEGKYVDYNKGALEAISTIRDQGAFYTEKLSPQTKAMGDLLNKVRDAASAAKDAESLINVDTLRDEYFEFAHLTKEYMETGRPEHLAEANAALTKLISHAREMAPTAKHGKSNLEAAIAASGQVVESMQRLGELQLVRTASLAVTDRLGPEIRAIGSSIEQSYVRDAQVLDEESDSILAATRTTTIVGLVVAIAFGAASAFFIARSTVRPITVLVNRLKDIAQGEGDLTQRVDEARQDELGELGKWFNAFVSKIHDVILEVSGSASEVAAASTEIAASNEEMAAAVNEVSAQTTQATTTASNAGQVAEEGGQVVQETVKGIQSLNEAASSSADCVGELFKRSEQIGNVISVIKDIADQTNLLALNAAIEAARAGEHGRGFAVVADEVRKLAERTTKATEEVSQSITDIQHKTTEAVNLMTTSKKLADEGSERATQAGQRLETIVMSAREVAALIEQISTATTEVGAAVTQSATASTQLSSKAESLRTLVSQFKTDSGRAAAAARSNAGNRPVAAGTH